MDKDKQARRLKHKYLFKAIKGFKGFTLIELLVATSIFVLITATIYSAFHTGYFGYRNIEETIDIYQSARRILERINLDLKNSIVYSGDETRLIGEPNKLSFLTLVDSYEQDKIVQDYAFVSYEFLANKLMRLCRENHDSLNDESETQAEEMATNLEGMTFSYGYIATPGEPIEFKENWEDKTALPVAVRIKLTIKDKIKQEFERTVYLPLAG